MTKRDWTVTARLNVLGKTVLTAESTWPRGELPSKDEISEIEGRVKSKFPGAEIVSMERSFVVGHSDSKVWWTIKWICF